MICRREPSKGGGRFGCKLSRSTPVRMIRTNSENVRPPSGWPVLSAAQIERRIDLRWALAPVRDSTGNPFEKGFVRGGAGVATIAIDLRIDDVAPQSHQGPVFPDQIQRDRGYCETLLNS